MKLLVMGTGLAGLSAAYHFARASKQSEIVLIEKSNEGCSIKAQGGIACALAENDSSSIHEQDTLRAGAGLCDENAVKLLVREGRKTIIELLELGAPFDKAGGRLSFGLEAAHSRKRILHSHGDETGKHITGFMRKLVREQNGFFEKGFLADFAVKSNACVGAWVEREGELNFLSCDACIVASGGYASIFSKTSNPPSSTGDGIAAAYRAGAVLTDLEFVQFHPTVMAGSSQLVSESVRGEGAVLVNDFGERFAGKLVGKELATRDVLTRAIFEQLAAGRHVFLDAGNVKNFEERFPSITAACLKRRINPSRDLIPVEPAAHYCNGGIKANLGAQTSVRRMLACGEAACTGVHGANRLASNSLLEALVFGCRAARTAQKIKEIKQTLRTRQTWIARRRGRRLVALKEIKKILWNRAGIIRNEAGLLEAKHLLAARSACDAEASNALTIASLLVKASLSRRESRGCHYRSDFPTANNAFRKHLNFSCL